MNVGVAGVGEQPSLGKYRIVTQLGRGSMADVSLAVADEQLLNFTKVVVIKTIRDELAVDGDFVSMFLDEARLAVRLNHPNVVQTLEVGQSDGKFYLVMEYLEGQSLARTLESAPGSMPLGLRLAVIADALNGLHYAHELTNYDRSALNVVHRDVTPRNIFITYAGDVKIVDFGIAKAEGRRAETGLGVTKGKVEYMAPEHVARRATDRRVDIYAAGVLIYEAALGESMWKGVPHDEVVRRLSRGENPRSPKARDASIHIELDRICKRALAPSPEDRYATALELQTDLESYLAKHDRRPSPRQIGSFVSERFTDEKARAVQLVRAAVRDVVSSRRPVVSAEVPISRGDAPRALSPQKGDTVQTRSATFTFSDAAANEAADARVTSPCPPLSLPQTSARDRPPSLTQVSAGIARPAARDPRVPARQGARSNVAAVAALLVVACAGAVAIALTMSRAPSAVTVTLRATPSGAHFRIDEGPSLPNPYVGQVPRDAKTHHVRVEAPGFAPWVEDLSFEADVSERFSLARSAK